MNNHPIVSLIVLGFGVGIGSYLMRRLLSGGHNHNRPVQQYITYYKELLFRNVNSGHENRMQPNSQDSKINN